jgi:transmembrane sensor
MTPTKDQVRIAAAGQAAEWFIANQDPAPDHSQRAAFIAWLKSSPMHIDEYLSVALVAHDLRKAADDSDEAMESLLEQARADATGRVVAMPSLKAHELPKQNFVHSRRWSMAAAAIVAAVSLALWISSEYPGTESQRYLTRHGEQSLQHLADGSTLQLNTDTAVEVRFDGGSRSIHLETGQAFFTVAHGDSRRFRVMADETEIMAVGTQFDVRLKGKSTVVTVVDGQVDVRTGNRQGAAPVRVMRVAAGYRLQIDGDVMPTQSERVDAQGAVAWLQRKIVFEREPLGEVGDEFNRYGIVQFVIEDAGLRALPVSGVFNAYDTDSFTAFLASLDGIRVERTPGEIHVMMQDAAQPREPPAAN